ncbi:MAG: prolipoprotein diacylglyceryl transferase [Verrucomicrobiales bacterium]|nr:prolipoprotein diacylglyceryl transferase [Verrucomicrobiales bacterium]
MHGTSYSAWMLGAVALSAVYWYRAGRKDARLPWIFLGGLIGAFVGAKVVYLLAEGWRDLNLPGTWQRWATGKTILGGLLGGYGGVEWAKKALRYREPTGDRFAIVVPIGIFLGRLGCLSHGCCLGQPCSATAWYAWTDPAGVGRWPIVPAELAFHASSALVALGLAPTRVARGQRFHGYLIAYGIFRFVTEFRRDTATWAGVWTGYHAAALALIGLGIWRGIVRSRSSDASDATGSESVPTASTESERR